MNFNDDNFAGGDDSQLQTENKTQPTATRVDDDNATEEKDLEKTFLFGKGDNHAHPTEGQGTGGQNFGNNNITPAGNDKNNPSQMAGDTNAYLARKEPSDEHPEDSNFTAKSQDGSPDYGTAQGGAIKNEAPKPEEPKRGDGENDRPHEQEPYTEGTDDNDSTNEPNVPGPQELPDQQKVGEGNNDEHNEA